MFFPWILSLLGGCLIGLAAATLLWSNGRILGVSGILGGLLQPWNKNNLWRLSFLLGLFLGALSLGPLGFSVLEIPIPRTKNMIIAGGFLVGLGTSIGGGCTSGHGVCGVSRLSIRSIVATILFMGAGIITVFLFGTFGGR